MVSSKLNSHPATKASGANKQRDLELEERCKEHIRYLRLSDGEGLSDAGSFNGVDWLKEEAPWPPELQRHVHRYMHEKNLYHVSNADNPVFVQMVKLIKSLAGVPNTRNWEQKVHDKCRDLINTSTRAWKRDGLLVAPNNVTWKTGLFQYLWDCAMQATRVSLFAAQSMEPTLPRGEPGNTVGSDNLESISVPGWGLEDSQSRKRSAGSMQQSWSPNSAKRARVTESDTRENSEGNSIEVDCEVFHVTSPERDLANGNTRHTSATSAVAPSNGQYRTNSNHRARLMTELESTAITAREALSALDPAEESRRSVLEGIQLSQKNIGPDFDTESHGDPVPTRRSIHENSYDEATNWNASHSNPVSPVRRATAGEGLALKHAASLEPGAGAKANQSDASSRESLPLIRSTTNTDAMNPSRNPDINHRPSISSSKQQEADDNLRNSNIFSRPMSSSPDNTPEIDQVDRRYGSLTAPAPSQPASRPNSQVLFANGAQSSPSNPPGDKMTSPSNSDNISEEMPSPAPCNDCGLSNCPYRVANASYTEAYPQNLSQGGGAGQPPIEQRFGQTTTEQPAPLPPMRTDESTILGPSGPPPPPAPPTPRQDAWPNGPPPPPLRAPNFWPNGPPPPPLPRRSSSQNQGAPPSPGPPPPSGPPPYPRTSSENSGPLHPPISPRSLWPNGPPPPPQRTPNPSQGAPNLPAPPISPQNSWSNGPPPPPQGAPDIWSNGPLPTPQRAPNSWPNGPPPHPQRGFDASLGLPQPPPPPPSHDSNQNQSRPPPAFSPPSSRSNHPPFPAQGSPSPSVTATATQDGSALPAMPIHTSNAAAGHPTQQQPDQPQPPPPYPNIAQHTGQPPPAASQDQSAYPPWAPTWLSHRPDITNQTSWEAIRKKYNEMLMIHLAVSAQTPNAKLINIGQETRTTLRFLAGDVLSLTLAALFQWISGLLNTVLPSQLIFEFPETHLKSWSLVILNQDNLQWLSDVKAVAWEYFGEIATLDPALAAVTIVITPVFPATNIHQIIQKLQSAHVASKIPPDQPPYQPVSNQNGSSILSDSAHRPSTAQPGGPLPQTPSTFPISPVPHPINFYDRPSIAAPSSISTPQQKTTPGGDISNSNNNMVEVRASSPDLQQPTQPPPSHPSKIDSNNSKKNKGTTPLPKIVLRIQTDSHGRLSHGYDKPPLNSRTTSTQFFAWFARETGRTSPQKLRFDFKDAVPAKASVVAAGNDDHFDLMVGDIKRKLERAVEFMPGLKEFCIVITDPEWVYSGDEDEDEDGIDDE